MANALKALSALLAYPTADLQAAAGAIAEALDSDADIPAAIRRRLGVLVGEIAADDLYDLEERYVGLFDRSRSLSLHLFEHVHGEGRDRGQAMVDLKALYEQGGLLIGAAELPDYLPLFLEFASTRPPGEAHDLLRQTAHILVALEKRLRERDSAYAAVFAALVAMAGEGVVEGEVASPADADPADPEVLDAAWEDAPVTFGPEAAPSCKDGLIARLRAAKRPAAQLEEG